MGQGLAVAGNMHRLIAVCLKKGFDNAVFQRMKVHNDQPAFGFEAQGGSFKAFLQFVQLIINNNPQSLKTAGGRVNRLMKRAFDNLINNRGKLSRFRWV